MKFIIIYQLFILQFVLSMFKNLYVMQGHKYCFPRSFSSYIYIYEPFWADFCMWDEATIEIH